MTAHTITKEAPVRRSDTPEAPGAFPGCRRRPRRGNDLSIHHHRPAPVTWPAGSVCLRTGCAAPRSTPDPWALGLCDHHNSQFDAGVIGRSVDPRVREHPVEDAVAIVEEIRLPGETDRALQRRTGLGKDFLYYLRKGSYTSVRSAVWEQLLEAKAAHDAEEGRWH